MNKKILFLLISLSIKLSAQEYKVELTNYKFTSEYSGITIDSIADARDEKNYIGFVSTGLMASIKPAYLDQPVQSYLTNLAKKYIQPGDDPEHLILRINKLVLTETPNGYSMQITAEMNISFIVKRDGKYYEKYRSIAYLEKNSEYSSASIYSKIIGESFERCIRQYINKKTGNIIQDTELVENELNENPCKRNDYRIRTITNFTKGVYNTYNDFLNYKIDSITKFDIEYSNMKNHTGKANLKDDNKKGIKNIWGFSDGKLNYCKLGNSFYPLQKEDSLFSIEHFPVQRDIIVPIVPAFGLLGGLIVALAAEEIQRAGIENRIESKTKYFLNYSSGRFYPYNQPTDLKFESNIVVFSSQFNKAGNDFDLYVNGEKYNTFSRSTYCRLGFPSDRKEVDITIKYNGENYSYKSHPLLFNTELLLTEVSQENKLLKMRS